MKHFFHCLFLPLFIMGSQWVTAQTQPTCGVSDQNVPESIIRLMQQAPQLLASQKARKAASPRNTCRVAVEIDSDTYLQFEKDTNRIRGYVLNQIDAVSQLYEREINTQLVVVSIHIWKDTEPDPYRGTTSIFTLLNTMATLWRRDYKEIPYDKATYLYTKSVTGAGGVAEGLPSVYSISPLTGLGTIAHEFGHNFGSPHTHDCSWPGGPIDFCAAIEGGNCYTASLERIPGSVMSYCNYDNSGFHPLCQAVMTSHADKTFTKLTTAPDKAPVLPVEQTLSGSPYLYWDGQPLTERYDVEISETADFTTKLVSDTTAVNGYDLSKLKNGQPYFVRVRAVNQLGVSVWSTVCQLRLAGINNPIPAPVLLSPRQDQLRVLTNNGNLSFSVQPVNGVTGYEVQLTRYTDERFDYPVKIISASPSFSISNSATGLFIWRVRAVVGNQTSPWSSVGRFFINALPYTLGLFSNGNALSFPFSYLSTSYDLPIDIVVATDSLFTQPVYQKTLLLNKLSSSRLVGMLENLRPNTQYYMKIEEINDGRKANYPIGVLSRLKQSFRTGSTVLSPQWSFINSGTYPGLLQGQPTAIKPTADALWASYSDDGLFRINTDSLSVQAINRNTTKGKIGGYNLQIAENKPEEIWVANAVSQYGGAAFVAARQVGKLSGPAGDLTERTVFRPETTYYFSFSVIPQLFYNNLAIYASKDESLTKVYEVPDNYYIRNHLTRPGIVWMIQSSYSNSTNKVVEFNLLTKTTREFSYENTPQLGRNLNTLSLDALGNLWVSQSSNTFPFPTLASFDGQSWTSYKSPATPFIYTPYLTSDSFGNLYALSSDNTQAMYRYDGQTWKKVGEIPGSANSYFGSMTIDGRGSIWFNTDYQIVRYNPCSSMTAPALLAGKPAVESGEGVTLRAEGCSSAIWSWSSTDGNITDQLIKGSNELVVNPTVSTTYRARCYTDGCSGTEAKLAVAVLPQLSIIKTSKTTYCAGDRLTAGFSLQGSVEPSNQYTLTLKSGSQTIRYPASVSGSDLSAPLSTTLIPGRYVVYAESSQPIVRSRDSVEIAIAPFPTAELSSNKTALMPGDSAQISIALTGAAPWQFTRWDRQTVQSPTSPYIITFKITQPQTYTLGISNLSDAACSTGIVKNKLTIGLTVLANEPATTQGFSVYPNPASDKLIIETVAPTWIARLQLSNIQGQSIKQKQMHVPVRRAEWDITDAPAGMYLLNIKTTDGKEVVWKLVKQ